MLLLCYCGDRVAFHSARWWARSSAAEPYFFPDFSFCDSADPAAVLEALPVRPSFSTLDAADAAFGLVVLPPPLLAIALPSLLDKQGTSLYRSGFAAVFSELKPVISVPVMLTG